MSAWSVPGTASSPSSPAGSNPPPVALDRGARPRRASGSSRRRTAGCPRRARRSTGPPPRAGPARGRRAGLAHRRLVERLEVEGEERPPAGAPARPSVEELGPGERDDQDRDVAAPLEQVLDEVERPGVRPVEVLEQQRDDAGRRRAARRTCATPRTARAPRRAGASAAPSSASSAGSIRSPLRRRRARASASDLGDARRASSPRRRSPAGRPATGPSRPAPRT